MMLNLLLRIRENIHRQSIQNKFRKLNISFFNESGEYRDTIAILEEVVSALRILKFKDEDVQLIYYIDTFIGIDYFDKFYDIFIK